VSSHVSTPPEICSFAHPVPRCEAATGVSAGLLRRSFYISTTLHLLLVAGAFAAYYWRPTNPIGEPQEIYTVSVLTLSELDTVLPQGSAAPAAQQNPLTSSPSTVVRAAPVAPAPRAIEMKQSPKVSQGPSMPPQDLNPTSSRSVADRESSGPVGVSNGDAIALEQSRVKYQDAVATLLVRAKRYPERAIKRHMTGEGKIRIAIASDGSVSEVEVMQSTGSDILDEELQAMVDRASPFPPFPADLKKSSLALVVPIAFRLAGQ